MKNIFGKILSIGKVAAPFVLPLLPGGAYANVAIKLVGAVKDAQDSHPTVEGRSRSFEDWIPIGLELIRPLVKKKTGRNMNVGRAVNCLRLGREFVLELGKVLEEIPTQK